MPTIALRQRSKANTCASSSQIGFTLIELMIIVTLLGVFASIAVPSFTQFIANNRTQSLNNEMLALLQFARSAAVERRTLLRVCKEENEWAVKTECTASSAAVRTMALPANTGISASTQEIVFRYNGTGTAAILYTCQGDDYANGYTIAVRSSGSVRSWGRGRSGTGTNDSMTTCGQAEPGSDDEEQN